ncbi:MAG: hypothetical protein AAFX00_06735, partial [Pseudomonadota bacterium]
TIVQVGLAIALALWLAPHRAERNARHFRTFAILAFIVANLAALDGSLWGDVVGSTLWGPESRDFEDYAAYRAAREAFEASALVISDGVYSVLWAIGLMALAAWAAFRSERALFNTAVTFGAIHALIQTLGNYYDQPLAYAIGGLAAVPLAWGLWRYNQWAMPKSEVGGTAI